MKIGFPGCRLLSLVMVTGIVGAMQAFTVPASAAVTCPTVDSVSHLVTPRPTPGVDWSGCNLSDANLNAADLANANLSHAVLPAAQSAPTTAERQRCGCEAG